LSKFVLDIRPSGLPARRGRGRRRSGEARALCRRNLAEALSKVAERGRDPGKVVDELKERSVLDGLPAVEPVTEADAIAIAALRPRMQRGWNSNRK
jgi:hypothetical protein